MSDDFDRAREQWARDAEAKRELERLGDAIIGVPAEVDLGALMICKLFGGHHGEGHILFLRGGYVVGRCMRCGAGILENSST